MSSATVGAGSQVGLAPASSSSKSCVPGSAGPPTTMMARSDGQRWRTASSRPATGGSTMATRARLSVRRNSYSAGVMSVLTGTATAPSLVVPQNAAANAGESFSASTTRCSISTPRPARPLAQRSTDAARSA